MLAILTSHPIQYQAPLWRALAEDGRVPFEVWFLTDHAVKPTHDRDFGKSFAWDRDLLEGYPSRFLPVRPDWRMDRFRGIRLTESWATLFKEHGVTRLWVEGWRFSENWAAIFAARRCGVEVWMRGETNDLRPRSGPKEIVRRLLLGRLFARVNRFLCIGTANRRFYQSFGIAEQRLLAAPYCVDNAWFAEAAGQISNQRSAIRKQWGIEDDAVCLLFCGKFISKKRPLHLVMAVRMLMTTSPGRKFHLVFVGSGVLGDALRAACHVVFDAENPSSQPSTRNAQLPSATFTGFLNQGEIVRAYVAADCLVLPSDTGETWGLVANEAMASGLPCVVSDQCGCAEDLVLPAPGCGVFPCGDISSLANLIGDSIQTSTAVSGLAEHIAKFSPLVTVETVAQVWEEER